MDLAKARPRLRDSPLGFSLSSPHQRDRFSLSLTSGVTDKQETLTLPGLFQIWANNFIGSLEVTTDWS